MRYTDGSAAPVDDGLATVDDETAGAMHILAVRDMHAENDEDKCTSCGVNPVWIGTMCQACAEASRPKPKPKGGE